MIVIEQMPFNYEYRTFAYQALIRAINAKNIPLFLWNSEVKNIYDLVDELKPDKILFHSDKFERLCKKIDCNGWNFNSWMTEDRLIADDIVLKRLNPDDNLKCETICIAPFSDVDKPDDKWYDYMDNKTARFRHFGFKRYGGHKDCGPLTENFFSLFLCSANQVICQSRQFAVNAYLCNTNIINHAVTEYDVTNCLSSKLIESII